MNIMFLMGGFRLETNKEEYPLYLTEVNGKTILERQVEYTRKIQPQQLLFCLKNSEATQFNTDSMIRQLEPAAKIIGIKNRTQGAICSALLATEYIDNDHELLLMAIDDFIEDDAPEVIGGFRKASADAGVVSFTSIHPRYSFAQTDANDIPVEFAEKKPISKNALVSFYYFKQGRDFVECAKEVIRKGNLVNGNFYISQTLNEMILKQKKITMRKISNDKFNPLKTEAQMAEYMYEHREKKDSK